MFNAGFVKLTYTKNQFYLKTSSICIVQLNNLGPKKS